MCLVEDGSAFKTSYKYSRNPFGKFKQIAQINYTRSVLKGAHFQHSMWRIKHSAPIIVNGIGTPNSSYAWLWVESQQTEVSLWNNRIILQFLVLVSSFSCIAYQNYFCFCEEISVHFGSTHNESSNWDGRLQKLFLTVLWSTSETNPGKKIRTVFRGAVEYTPT